MMGVASALEGIPKKGLNIDVTSKAAQAAKQGSLVPKTNPADALSVNSDKLKNITGF